MESSYNLMKRNKPPWRDVLAAILATFESLLIPLVVIVIGLIIAIILFRILFL
jgi:hypothetical protein